MKKITSAIKKFIANSFDCIAPYTVLNAEMKKEHSAWTWTGAMEWTNCYDADSFGETSIYNFNGELIASKGN